MQPGVTVVLASIWLVVVVVPVGVLGAATHLTFDQYSPLPPDNDGVYRRVEDQLDWKDHDPTEDRSLDFSIGPRTSISAKEPLRRLFKGKYLREDLTFTPAENGASLNGDSPSLGDDKESRNFAGTKFTNVKVDHGDREFPEPFSREIPPAELEDPFVADDTFQDQGPGSVEIYKLDLFKEKALLSPAPTALPSPKNKSKAPKKTSRANWKPKTSDFKATSPKIHYRQSNFFDELRTVVPPNGESFGNGGVPELQVGCEGLEASSHKLKRSIDIPRKEKSLDSALNPWHDVTPISLDLDYELSSEEGYEEMDELLKLKKLESTTKRPKQNRGDMDATLHVDESLDKRRSDKLPVRGDLGKSSAINGSTVTVPSSLIGDQKTGWKNGIIKPHKGSSRGTPAKRETPNEDLSPDGGRVKHSRKLLWLEDFSPDGSVADQKRSKRVDWGFGEDEGVVASDELQTENERRRQMYERRRQEQARRSEQVANHTNSEISKIREEYERMLQQKERQEEERRQRLQQSSRRLPTNTREDDERRREEERRRQYAENLRRLSQPRSQLEEEERLRRLHEEDMRRRRKWQEEERRKQEMEGTRREYPYRLRTATDEELKKERLREEEFRRREQSRLEEEKRRRQQLEADKRLRQQEEDRRREQQEEERRRQRGEEERRRQQQVEIRRRQDDEERRRQLQEEERKRRLEDEETRRKEQSRRREDTQRRQHDEHRNRTTASPERRLPEEDRRRLEERQREWMMKRRQEEEEERRRQGQTRNEVPSNLVYPYRPRANDTRHETEAERNREQQEREREQKLREYVQRNQPINVDRHADRRRTEEQRRRQQEEEEQRRRMEEQRRREEEERKLQEYVRRNQPMHVERANESYPRNWLENRRIIDEARQYDRSRYPGPETDKRNHGPSAPTSIDPRSYTDEARRRQEARRLEEERRMHDRQKYEEEDQRREVRRREEEYRRLQSRKYEEDRKRQEAARLEDERRRKELIEEEGRRSQARRTRPLENARPEYEDRRRLLEHRRQGTSLVPGNLVLDESRRAMERERQMQELERRRLETERLRQEERRMQEARQKEQRARGMMSEQRRRHEEARLNALPVSARIILHSGVSPTTPPPGVMSRGEFGNDIDFLGINPNRQGIQVSRFPVPPTARPPAKSPGPCVWAVVQCCPSNSNRLVTCFESMGCPGINWDPNPCRGSIADAAREEVMKFYAAAEGDNRF